MAAIPTIVLHAQMSPELDAALSALADAADRSLEVRDALIHLFDAGPEGGRIDRDRLLAARAIDGGIVLEPSEWLLELVAAARAGQGDLCISKIHGSPFREQ